MGDANAVAKAFVDFYYQTFDSNRPQLASLYKDHSNLSFEGQMFSGPKIIEKLTNLPFQKVQHQIVTIDAQPSNPQPGPLLVAVTGRLLVDQETNPMQVFSSNPVFASVPAGAGRIELLHL